MRTLEKRSFQTTLKYEYVSIPQSYVVETLSGSSQTWTTQSNPWIDPTHVHVWFKYNNPVTKLYKLSRQFMPYKHNYYSYTNNYDKSNTIVKKISCSDDIDFHFV